MSITHGYAPYCWFHKNLFNWNEFIYSSGLNNSPVIFLFFSAVAVWKPVSFGYLWKAALALINTLCKTIDTTSLLLRTVEYYLPGFFYLNCESNFGRMYSVSLTPVDKDWTDGLEGIFLSPWHTVKWHRFSFFFP